MYKTPNNITKPVGNNAFQFEKRKNKELFIPSLKKISSFEEIHLGKEIVFEEENEKGIITSYTGIENIYEMQYDSIQAKIYLFDNHNHAYYFWHLAKHDGLIENEATLFHIDEHADMRDPEVYLSKEALTHLENIYDYTNFTLNVGNYIIPAEKDGLVQKTYQIRSETALKDILDMHISDENNILNLDLDFFHPDLDFIPFALKKEVILKLAQKCKVITIATSPYFIDQKLALNVFKKLFN